MDTESRSGEFVLNKQEHAESAEKPEVVLDNNIEPKPITESTTNRPHFYTSFCQNPEGVMFEEQGENEKILLLIRRDFVTNVPWIVASIIFIFLPFLVVVLFRSLIPQLSLTNAMQITILAFYYLILFGFVLVEFTIWYFNVSFVTNERLVDIDIAGILYKNIAETKLDLIQDVSYTQIGVIRSIFNYGDVLVQTAGSLPSFEFPQASKPAKVVRIIETLIGGKDDTG